MLNPDLRRVAEKVYFTGNSVVDLRTDVVTISSGCQEAFNMFSNIPQSSEAQRMIDGLFAQQMQQNFGLEFVCLVDKPYTALSCAVPKNMTIHYSPLEFDEYDFIDYHATEERIKDFSECGGGNAIYIDNSSYPRQIDWNIIYNIASKVNLKVIANIGNTAGQILTGLNFSPESYADIIIGSTAGTMGGMQTTFVLSNEPLTPTVDILPAVTAANVQAVYELHPSTGAKDKIQWPIKMLTRKMADILISEGIELCTSGTHQNFLTIPRDPDTIGFLSKLEKKNIKVSTNRNYIIIDSTFGVKTGRSEEWFEKVAYDIADIINDHKRGNANGS